MKLFFLTLAFNLLVNITALVFAYLFNYNLVVYNSTQFFSVAIIILLFNSFESIKLKKINIVYLIPFFALLWIIFYSTSIDSFFTYSSFSYLISILVIALFSLIYIMKLVPLTQQIIYKSHLFWLLSGIFSMHLLLSIPEALFLFISIYEIVNLRIVPILNNFISILCFILAFYFYNKNINQIRKNNFI